MIKEVTQPFFTIITCTYNSETFLNDNIASVEKQTLRDFEHIFVDAFSTDQTMEIIKSYQARHSEQVRIYQVPPKGISNAMNFGIEHAKGKVILHLHSDDFLYSPGVLHSVEKVFNTSPADIVIGNCQFLSEHGLDQIWPQSKLKRFFQKLFYKNFLFFINNIPHPSTYIKKEVFTQYGTYSEELKNVMDYEFWFRVFKKVHVVFTDAILSVYRAHINTTSNLFSDRARAEIKTVFAQYRQAYRFERVVNFIFLYPIYKLFKFFKFDWLLNKNKKV